MSERSMIRAHGREAARRNRRRARQAGTGAAVALGAAIAFAPAADAATFPVSNLNDTGPDSLRDAITQANLTADPDVVTFAPGLTGTITLTTGQIEIEAATDIRGPGAGTLAVSGNDASRIFALNVPSTGDSRDPVSISGLTLRNGSATDGGAIYSNETDMTLTAMTLRDNVSNGTGGAIDVDESPVSIIDSRLTGNESSDGGGALYTDGDNAATNTQDTVTIRNSVIDANESTNNNGGALYFDNATGGDVRIVGTQIAGNSADGTGGGIHFYGHKGSQTISDSTISGNSSTGRGGGMYVNTDYDDPAGLLVENTTISGNTSDLEGGGAFVENTKEKPMRFRNSTIANNKSSGLGGGIYRADFDVSLSSTIVADNDNLLGDGDDLAESVTATDQFTIGFSLVEQDTAGVTIVESPTGSNKFAVDPQLGPLGAAGGPTPTQVLPITSPAIDAGIANGLATDQRGLTRTVEQPVVPNATGSDGTDMGAVELQDSTLDGAAVKVKRTQKQKGKKIKVKVVAGADEAVEALASGEVKAGKKSYTLKDVGAAVDAGKTKTLTLKPKSKKGSKKIAKVLAAGKKAKAKLTIVLTDAAGNEDTINAKATLKAAKKKK